MNKIFLIIITSLFITNCTLNKVVKHHGVHALDKKQEKLTLNKSNTSDIYQILGPPSTTSMFDNDLWIYIERKITKGPILKLGANKLTVNNILVLEINSQGILKKKEFFDITDTNNIKFSKRETSVDYSKRSFVYDFISSMRQKISDPLGKRKNKN
jgi:outer membrane protein assembly factor BamE (lipoprotein component of BamABCDE complex)|tara:strand:+ start:323 stop:790 length:468 start_codon:yes stop_codon:yes gene_type:complete